MNRLFGAVILIGSTVGGCTPPALIAGTSLGTLLATGSSVVTTANSDAVIANEAAPVVCKTVGDLFDDFDLIAKSFNVGANIVARADKAANDADIICGVIAKDNPQSVVADFKTLLDAYNALKLAHTQAQLAAVTK